MGFPRLAEAQPVAERIWRRITIDDDSSCWMWPNPSKQDGYGRIWIGSRTDGSRRLVLAHRLAYETFVGEVPRGLVLDHTCENKRCVNPDHLEPVTPRENLMRSDTPAARQAAQDRCKRGHAFTAENTYRNKGKRYCRTCRSGTQV